MTDTPIQMQGLDPSTTMSPIEDDPAHAPATTASRTAAAATESFPGLARRSSSASQTDSIQGSTRGSIRRNAVLPSAPRRSADRGAPPEHAGATASAGAIADIATHSEAAELASLDALREAGFRPQLVGLQKRLKEIRRRPIDVRALAELLTEVRSRPLAHGANDSMQSNRKLLNGITSEHLDRLYKALGVSAAEVNAMKKQAYHAGYLIPTSSTLCNIANYLVLPFLTSSIEDPRVSALISLGMVGIVQPIVTARAQSHVIGAIDFDRRRKAPEIKLDKEAVNSKQMQSEIRESIGKSIDQVKQSEQTLKELLERHNIDGTQVAPEVLLQLAKDHPDIVNASTQHVENLLKLSEKAGQMQALDGAHARQIESTIWQIPARALRAGSGILGPLLSQHIGTTGVTGVAAGIATVAIAAQHWLAGRDEVNGLVMEHKLNLLHADVLKEDRKQAAHLSAPVPAVDIDVQACRDMVSFPEQVIVLRVADRLKTAIEGMKARLENLPPREQGSNAQLDDMERGDPSGRTTLLDKIAAYEQDESNLRNSTLTPDMHEDTKTLLDAAYDNKASFLWQEGSIKASKPLEYSAQLSQRIGQTFTGIAFGGAGATAGSRLTTALLGGASHVPLLTQELLQVASALTGVFAAVTQGAVVNIKNRRRDADPEKAMGFAEQTARGAAVPYYWVRNLFESSGGLGDASTAFQGLTHHVKDLALSLHGLAETAVADSASESAEPAETAPGSSAAAAQHTAGSRAKSLS